MPSLQSPFDSPDPPLPLRHTNHNSLRSAFAIALAATVVGLSGCHSAYISATVSNRTAATITLVQVEYPSASFGAQAIAPGQEFKYRFKVLGSGSMRITYTDLNQHEHKATGPTLQEGNEGPLDILVANDGVHWQPGVFAH